MAIFNPKLIIKNLDHKASSFLHQADSFLLSILLYPFAALFHVYMIAFVYLNILILSQDLVFTVWYMAASAVSAISTYYIKCSICRARPKLISTVSKPHYFRQKEKNYSMPSGDAMQAAVLAVFMYYLGAPISAAILVFIGVAVSRVYFMCHWIGDTLFGGIVSALIGLVFAECMHQSWFLTLKQQILNTMSIQL